MPIVSPCSVDVVQASVEHSMAGQAGSHAGSGDGSDDEEAGSDDEADWYEGAPCLEDFDGWPDQPVMLCPDPALTKQVRYPCLVVIGLKALSTCDVQYKHGCDKPLYWWPSMYCD